MVHIVKLILLGCEKRPACNDFQVLRFALLNYALGRFALNYHSSDENHIRPGKFTFFELVHVHIHKTLGPFLR